MKRPRERSTLGARPWPLGMCLIPPSHLIDSWLHVCWHGPRLPFSTAQVLCAVALCATLGACDMSLEHGRAKHPKRQRCATTAEPAAESTHCRCRSYQGQCKRELHTVLTVPAAELQIAHNAEQSSRLPLSTSIIAIQTLYCTAGHCRWIDVSPCLCGGYFPRTSSGRQILFPGE